MPGLLLRNDETVKRLESTGTVLGLFGEERLIESLLRHRRLPANELVAEVVAEVQNFDGREQHDDITLTVAKCR